MESCSRWFSRLLLSLSLVAGSAVADDRLGPWGMSFLRSARGILSPVPMILEGRGPTRAAFTIFATGFEVRAPAETIQGLTLLRDHFGYPIHGIWIETQHIRFSPQEIRPLVTLANAAGFHTIVRTPTERRDDIQGYLDTGAGGLVIPVVERREQVREAFENTYFRAFREAGFSPDLGNLQQLGTEHLDAVDDGKILAFMIESVAGVERIEDLVAEAGHLCDLYRVVRRHLVFWMGPYDLKFNFQRRNRGATNDATQHFADESMTRVARVVNTAGFSMGGHMGSLAVGDKLTSQHDFRIFTIPGVADAAFNPSSVSPARLFKDADDGVRGRFRNQLQLSEGERAALAAAQVCVGQVIEEGMRGSPERAPHS